MSTHERFRGFKREVFNKLILKTAFPIEVSDPRKLLPRLYALNQEGYGFIFAVNHEKIRDVFDIMNMMFDDHHFNTLRFGSAMAWHQYYHRFKQFIVRPTTSFTEIETTPVVTPHTVRLASSDGKKIPPLNHGLKKFAENSISIISEAGFVGIAPQAEVGNLPDLLEKIKSNPKEQTPKAMSNIIRFLQIGGVEKFAVLFLGIESNSNKQLPLGVKHRINVGSVLTNEELMDIVRISGKHKNPNTALDVLTLEYLNALSHGGSNFITDLFR